MFPGIKRVGCIPGIHKGFGQSQLSLTDEIWGLLTKNHLLGSIFQGFLDMDKVGILFIPAGEQNHIRT
jgi:hypothetical protein